MTYVLLLCLHNLTTQPLESGCRATDGARFPTFEMCENYRREFGPGFENGPFWMSYRCSPY